MKITFHGAAQTVTGSQHLIEVNGLRILLDCGLYQGRRSEAREINRELPFDCSTIDAMILSHAHIDHSGNIPNLVRNGFNGDVICTFATRDLCSAMLRDSGHIQERDAEYVNRKRKKRGEAPIDPIYTEEDAVKSLQYFLSIGYDRPYRLAPGITVTFKDAGHMLGSAIVILDIEDEDEKRNVRLVFSGDLGRTNIPIIRDPSIINEADVLIMESTYGGRRHPANEELTDELQQVVEATWRRDGKVIIPSFAVGRTQQLVYMLNTLCHDKKLPDLDVYVDSPLAVNVTDIFRLHPEAFDKETLDYLTQKDPDGDVFGFQRLRYIRHVEDSKALNFLREPAIIISASGMMEHGRILHHLKNNIEDDANTILVVGWQAPHTLGRRIVDEEPRVRIFGEEYSLRAQVVVMNAFSGHADHDELIEWVGKFEASKPQHIFLVHGELEAATDLKASLRNDLGYQNVEIPERGQSFKV
ncbi:MAG: MBL fold metallo-hydrolase [Chloroflexi bacterium]|nr:MBL fold metallo-hydrolase [Chloroflexota bacterium]